MVWLLRQRDGSCLMLQGDLTLFFLQELLTISFLLQGFRVFLRSFRLSLTAAYQLLNGLRLLANLALPRRERSWHKVVAPTGCVVQWLPQCAGGILGSRGAAERLRNCWGAATERTTEQLQDQMKACTPLACPQPLAGLPQLCNAFTSRRPHAAVLQATKFRCAALGWIASSCEKFACLQDIVGGYVSNGDGSSAQRQLLELGVPAYHHEFVAQTFKLATSSPAAHSRLLALLDLLASSGTISQVRWLTGLHTISCAVCLSCLRVSVHCCQWTSCLGLQFSVMPGGAQQTLAFVNSSSQKSVSRG